MKNKITTGVAGAVIGAVVTISLSTMAQTTMTVEKDNKKVRDELIITRTKKVDVVTTITLKEVIAEIAVIDKQLAELDAQIVEYKKDTLIKRAKLIALKKEIEAKLPVR